MRILVAVVEIVATFAALQRLEVLQHQPSPKIEGVWLVRAAALEQLLGDGRRREQPRRLRVGAPERAEEGVTVEQVREHALRHNVRRRTDCAPVEAAPCQDADSASRGSAPTAVVSAQAPRGTAS